MATSPPGPVPADVSSGGSQGAVEVDSYRSLFVIGRGGMGTVEVALELGPRGFERVVALKRLLPEGARDPRHKEMFLREARLAALLAHPNVVHAYAYGELSGQLFMAMEYVEGEPLSHVLEQARQSGRRLPASLVAPILAQVCDGLHAAHELRDDGAEGQPLHVVHRDVSPQNVIVGYDGHVKLLDFGVAKFDAAGHQTRTGEVKGKMAYMSPEQALGERLDRRSDLFSVGAVLFECLAGVRMWGSGTDLEVMRKLALEEPPRLDEATAAVPRGLCDLHARLVARDPQARPATARDVAEALRGFAGAAGTVEPVRRLMQELFGRQAQRRRAMLDESLRSVADGVDATDRRVHEGETTGGIGSSHDVARPAEVTETGRARVSRAPTMAALGVLAIAASFAATTRPPDAGAAPPGLQASGPQTATATRAPPPVETGLPAAGNEMTPAAIARPAVRPTATFVAALPAALATVLPVTTAAPRLRAAAPPIAAAPSAPPVPSASPSAPPAPAPPAASAAKLPDVDPTPF